MRIVWRKRSRRPPSAGKDTSPRPGETKAQFSKRLRLTMADDAWPFKCPDCGRNMAQTAKRCNGCTRANGGRGGCVTAEERNGHALCDALKNNGQRCRAWAGMGTDHPGVGHCKFHLGSAPPHETKLIRQEALSLMVKNAEPVEDMTPEAAVLNLLRVTAGHCSWLRERITTAADERDASVYMLAYGQERDRWLKVSAVALQYGLTAYEGRIESQQVEGFIYMLDVAMGELGYTKEERQLFGAQFRKIAAEVNEDPADLEMATARLAELRDRDVTDAEVVD